MAELCVAFAEDLPDCRGQLLQTVKECFRQILKLSFLGLDTHGLGTRYVNNVGFKCGQMSFTLERSKRMFVHLLKPSD